MTTVSLRGFGKCDVREYTPRNLNLLPLTTDMHRSPRFGTRRMRFTSHPLAAIALTMLWAPVALTAQNDSYNPTRELAPGVSYTHSVDVRGPWSMHVVRIDLQRADIELRAVRAREQLRGRERPTEMVRRSTSATEQIVAAVNADFFDIKTGENENNQILGGEWWKGLKVTDSPFDTFDNAHVQFAMDGARHPHIDRFILDGKVWDRGVMTPLITVNARPGGTYEGTTLYTTRFGARTPGSSASPGVPRSSDPDAARDTTLAIAEAPLLSVGHHGDTLLYLRRGAVSATSGSTIPTDGAVLSAYGPRAKEVHSMREGDTVRVLLATAPRLGRGATPTMLLGGWPRLVRDGVNVAADAATTEGTISRNAEVRHPRTAIGYSKDGKTLWLFVVDGRSAFSVGMTLVEMADQLRTLGAWQAMNFDGGGSTTMVIDGKVVNQPTDPTGEREVGNALVVVKHR